jgi:hypothetical protein
MGCFLLTETMSRRHQLSMASYDRLFPNQDTMPKGGFGNLIALPLQHGVRERGNSVFVDKTFVPYDDQWRLLARVQRMAPATVQALADDAASRGQVIGVRLSDTTDDDERAPWTSPPSGRPREMSIPGPLPPTVRAVLGQRLYVEKAGLPSPLLNQLKRLAAFQNRHRLADRPQAPRATMTFTAPQPLPHPSTHMSTQTPYPSSTAGTTRCP